MEHIATRLEPAAVRDLVSEEPIILEIGSHDGSDTALFLDAMPHARIFCFEPEQRATVLWKRHIWPDGQVTLYEVAVSDEDGYKMFYASTGQVNTRPDWTYSGSLQRPTRHLTYSPEVKFKPPELVPCARLDTWLDRREDVDRIDFIWADVQGGQRGLIAGGLKTLAVTRYLYIECHHEPLYDGEPTQDELIAMLPAFEPLAVYEGDNILFRNRMEL